MEVVALNPNARAEVSPVTTSSGAVVARVLVAGAALGVGLFGVGLVAAPRVPLLVLLAAAAAVDARSRRIPNVLVVAGLVSGVGLVLAGGLVASAACGGALVAGAFFFLARVASGRVLGEPGLGWGDVKLALVVGLFLGWAGLWALYLAVVLAALVGVAGLAAGRIGRRHRLPLAPFVLAGALLEATLLPAARVLAWLSPLAP